MADLVFFGDLVAFFAGLAAGFFAAAGFLGFGFAAFFSAAGFFAAVFFGVLAFLGLALRATQILQKESKLLFHNLQI
jgi:fatty acid desaturase